MFGYVRVDKPEMRIREYEYYRGVYCGLCRSLGKCGGQCARFTLSYDFAFMALVRMAILGEQPKFKRRGCIAHPFKKRMMAEYNESLTFCASSSLLLAYHKIKDDVADEKGGKKFKAVMAKPLFSTMKKRPSKRYSQLDKKIESLLGELSAFEKADFLPSVDRPAEIFGNLLGEIMAEGLDGAKRKIAQKIGNHIGKWIYVIDACDDYYEDVKRGRFNPLIGVYGKDGLDKAVCEGLETALTHELMEAEKAFDLIDYPNKDMKEIICNIIYLGMPSVAKTTVKKLAEREEDTDE